jgi:hypothetical protein
MLIIAELEIPNENSLVKSITLDISRLWAG